MWRCWAPAWAGARAERNAPGTYPASGPRLRGRPESGWDRTNPGAANANRLIPADDLLDRTGGDRIADLQNLSGHSRVRIDVVRS